MRIRGGSGLGDSLYVRPIAEYYARAGGEVTVASNHPDVFIGAPVKVESFRRDRIDVVAHYVVGKADTSTTQWRDVCKLAGAPLDLPFGFSWTVLNTELVSRVATAAAGRPIVLVHGGRNPMARTDGFGMELLPRREAFEAVLEAFAGCYLVRIGKKEQEIYPLPSDEDLNGSTRVSDLLDLAQISQAVVAQCSFAVPLAEAFDKPLLAVWSAKGLAAREPYIRAITPQKVLEKRTSSFVMDDWPLERITEAARAFRPT